MQIACPSTIRQDTASHYISATQAYHQTSPTGWASLPCEDRSHAWAEGAAILFAVSVVSLVNACSDYSKEG